MLEPPLTDAPADLLSGRVCVVTGAGRGIGRYAAEMFARHGARIAACSRSIGQLHDLEEAVTRAGSETLWRRVDVSQLEEVEAFAAAVGDEYGRADVLVNCAGIQGPVGPLTDVDLAGWRRTVEVNLIGAVHAIRAFVPMMRRCGGGRIINMSGGGIGGSSVAPRISAYIASKAAVVGLTEALGRELAEDRVWVNALAPGGINTSFVEPILEAGPAVAGEALYAATARQREGGDPLEPVGRALLFLASDRSSGLTGKLVSAKWDDTEALAAGAHALSRTSQLTLRRIDSVLFAEVPSR